MDLALFTHAQHAMANLSSTVLAGADLVRLGIQVPQVLVPQHPAVIDGVAVGAVVVAIGGVSASIVLGPVFSLKLQRE